MRTEELRSVALVVNAGSRTGAQAAQRAEQLTRQAGFEDVVLHQVDSGDDLAQTIDDVVAQRPDLLVVGGGDGTVSCAAGRVAGTDVVLGVLPLGTANDFARTLEVPFDVDAAVGVLSTGKVVDIDLGRFGDRTFLNTASFGLSVGLTSRLTDGLKKKLGPAAYPVATLRAYRSVEPFSMRLEFPAEDHEPVELDDLLQVTIGNGRHYGGGNTVSPNASVDDQLLDVDAIVRGRMRDHVSIARLLKSGSLVEHENVHHYATERVQVTTDRPMQVNADGEIGGETPTEFRVDRNALHVVIPADSRAAEMG